MKSRKKIIPYNPELKQMARQLRNKGTLGEVMLWRRLKRSQFMGYDFHRQKPLLSFIVDFYCPRLNLAIEVDGNSHVRTDVSAKDFDKQVALENYGMNVLRFTEKQVRFKMDDVLHSIELYVRNYEVNASV